MKYQFPKDFKWGSAVWAQGTEDMAMREGKAPTVWDEYYRLAPERFYNQAGPDDTIDWYHRYPEYAKLAKDIGHNSFRTSISWARLLPDGKTINEKAVTFYKNMFSAFKEQGMELAIVLYWFDMPLLYEEKGGFTNRENIEDFVFYCKTCFDLFDGLVDIWYVYNEPIVDVFFKYLENICYPNILDFEMANQAVYNMVIAHAKVVEVFKKKPYQAEIGTVLSKSFVYPRSQHVEDLKAKKLCEMLEGECFEQPLLNGEIALEWLAFMKEHKIRLDIRAGDSEIIKNNTIRVLGINTYQPTRVKAKETMVNPKAPLRFESFYDNYEMHGRKMNTDRGWEIYPQNMYDVLLLIKEKYNNPKVYITENGMGIQEEGRYRDASGTIQDTYRIEYVQEHLKYAHQAIQEGVNLVGYNMWSFIDLWSPTNQFKNCYGFYEFDLTTKEVRRKQSANWFEKITKNNGF